jgi:hypothetical protein
MVVRAEIAEAAVELPRGSGTDLFHRSIGHAARPAKAVHGFTTAAMHG